MTSQEFVSPVRYSLREDFADVASHMKSGTSLSQLMARAIEIENQNNEVLGYLVPFSKLDSGDGKKITLLSQWRDAHQYAYPSRFPVTHEGTSRWLDSAVLENSSRLLFWVVDNHARPLGHLGLLYRQDFNDIEVDNVLRGSIAEPGLMTHAMKAIERFAEKEFAAQHLTLRVLKSNTHAFKFYERIGYKVEAEESLDKVISGEGFALIPGSKGDDFFLTMGKNLILDNPIPELILTAGPSISAREKSYALDAASTGWNAHHSDYLKKFEGSFAEYVGAKYAMATSSCTGALHISLLALGIGPGDEVIVPEITWVATASAVRYVGATPIFAEVDASTWLINKATIEPLITAKTKAIIPVHLYGFGVLMPEIIELARSHNIAVVEDAAPAIGTLIDGQSAGSFGDFGCYSFQGAKMLVTGEGGMLVTNDPDLYARAYKIQDHGRKPGTFWIDSLGYKYKMSNLTASLGLAQLERSEKQIERKRRIRKWYEEELSGIPGLKFQTEDPRTRSIHWMTSVDISELGVSRDGLIASLRENGIDSRPVFPAISQYPIWGYEPKAKPVADSVGRNSINLPSGVHLSRNSVQKIGQVLRSLV
jgi:perosamine synthetase